MLHAMLLPQITHWFLFQFQGAGESGACMTHATCHVAKEWRTDIARVNVPRMTTHATGVHFIVGDASASAHQEDWWRVNVRQCPVIPSRALVSTPCNSLFFSFLNSYCWNMSVCLYIWQFILFCLSVCLCLLVSLFVYNFLLPLYWVTIIKKFFFYDNLLYII